MGYSEKQKLAMHRQWLDYSDKIYILLRGELTDWEREFIMSINKKLGNLSDKQMAVLKRICNKYFSS